MKKVILNGITLTSKEIYGVQRYATELLFELDRILKPGMLEVVVPENGERELSFKNITVTKLPIGGSRIRREIWNDFSFPRYVRKQGGISMELTNNLPIFNCDIIAVHDCIIERCKENANTLKKRAARLFRMFKTFINVRRAKAIVTLTEHSKNDISEYYHIPVKRMVITGCGWQHFERIIPDENTIERLGVKNRPYFFALGSRLWHKNFKWIAEAAKQNPQYLFIVSGSNDLGTSDTSLNESIDNLIYAGYLSDGEIKALMMHCKAFLQPSLYEGFGIPPMEAMSCGARCIVSNRMSLPEVYKDSVWYIDPEKYDGIDLDAIMSREIRDNKEVLDRFSWKCSAERLYWVMKYVGRKSEKGVH